MNPRHIARHLVDGVHYGIRSLFLPPASVPVPTTSYPSTASGRSDRLVVLMPGRGSRATHFERHGFVASAREHRLAADLLAVDLHFGYYLKADPLERLRRDVLEPARTAGYTEVALVGISVGAAAAVGAAREYSGSIAGIILMGPFLGPEAMIEEISAAGLGRWSPGSPDLSRSFEPFFARNWEHLRRIARDPLAPPVLLAFGESDRYAAAQRLLAEILPPERVIVLPGGHDWITWGKLWESILTRRAFPFAARASVAAP
ncbi:MAG TPA: alpha/beta fold hydrolase [Candidatus Polarisedimenticolia bacterium]|nr:alpha/beta fold hydrolase [Candidatus Polarisedimenticolia bacterium]